MGQSTIENRSEMLRNPYSACRYLSFQVSKIYSCHLLVVIATSSWTQLALVEFALRVVHELGEAGCGEEEAGEEDSHSRLSLRHCTGHHITLITKTLSLVESLIK